MALRSDFPAPIPTTVRRTTVPHAGGPRTDTGSPPVADALASYEYGDPMPPGLTLGAPPRAGGGVAEGLDAEWRDAYAVLARTEGEWAELHARFGPAGQADAHRRALRGVIATALRDDARAAGRKLTEAECEDAACADARYTEYLDALLTDGTRYAVLTSERARAKEMLEWCRTRGYLLTAEARLAPGGIGS